ncbi:MAG TPA: hypothetical protein VFG35_00360 [Actinoplanes sp.]|nr:hypothetical protein [Actinoplanes sp.]
MDGHLIDLSMPAAERRRFLATMTGCARVMFSCRARAGTPTRVRTCSPPQAWEPRREEFCALVGKPADGRVGLEQGLDELHTALGDLEQVLASTGPDQVGSVRLDEQGTLVIPQLSAEDVPAEATAVKEELAGMLPLSSSATSWRY